MSTSTPERRSPLPRPRRAGRDAGPRASFRQLLPYITAHRGLLAAAIALSVVGAGANLLVPLLSSRVIAGVQAGSIAGGVVAAIVAAVVLSGILSGAQHYLLQRMGTSVVLGARRRLVERMLRLPIREYDQRRTGDLVSRVGSDTTLLYAVMTQGLVDAVGASLVFLGAVIGMLVLDPVLFGLTVAVIVLSGLAAVTLSRGVRRASREQQERVGALAAAVERALGAIRTIRAAGATERETHAIAEQALGAYRAGVRVARASALIVPIAGIAVQVSFLVVLGVGGFRVAAGALSIASLIAFVMFLFMLLMPLGQMIGALNSVNQALGAVGRIQEIIDLPAEDEDAPVRDAPERALPDRDGPAHAAPDRDENEGHAVSAAENPVISGSADAISFEFVEFGYPAGAHGSEAEKVLAAAGLEGERDVTVLRGVSFSVPRGKRTALVGPSGAGKSTILALIERFYDPSAGTIRFDGRDIRELDRAELRARIGYVEQDAPVLAGTIRDNLLLGAPGASDEDCRAVLASVNLGRVLEREAAGLDAEVGEQGIMLSGGERQRLAIARTLLAAPPVLLLDESTSSLDGVNEQLMREAIDAVATGRTLVVIAHRLATVVDADRIVVLDAGRVVGVGSHAELLRTTPLYAELARHQLLA
ncbi:MAG: ABC transporter ATP-binding protein [Microbacteriaceae bacterium]